MVSLDDAVVARLARFGHTFEILVDPEAAADLASKMQHEEVSDEALLACLAVEDVFVDHSEGERASNEQRQEAFETTDFVTIVRRILDDGEVQLTTEQRKTMLENKYKRIVETICRNAWNPQTKTPHPKERIERALDEAKFRADPMRRVEEQVQDALGKLRPLMPIAFDNVRVAIKIEAEHAGAAYGVVRTLGELKKEEWQNDGSLVVVLQIPAGAQGEVYERLNQVTHGSVETKLLD